MSRHTILADREAEVNGEITARECRRCNRSPAVAAVANCNRNQLAVQSYRGLTVREREKNRELKWSMSPALPALGVGAKRIIKELKVLKSRCILARDVVLPAAFPFPANETGRREGDERRGSRV